MNSESPLLLCRLFLLRFVCQHPVELAFARIAVLETARITMLKMAQSRFIHRRFRAADRQPTTGV
jgi:hypothetical protein